MGLSVSKGPEIPARHSLEASDDPFLAKSAQQDSRTEFCKPLKAEMLLQAYETAWFGEQSSSSAWHNPLDYCPPATPSCQTPRNAPNCSSPTTPPPLPTPPRICSPTQGWWGKARHCSLPVPKYDNMDDLTDASDGFDALAEYSPPYRGPIWTRLPDTPLHILRSLSDPSAVSTSAPSDAKHSNRHHKTNTSSTQQRRSASQKLRSTADVVSSRIKNWWSKSTAGMVAAAAHHPL